MEKALQEQFKREELQRLLHKQNSMNYPVAAKAVNDTFLKRDLKAVGLNELRYFSSKPLAVK